MPRPIYTRGRRPLLLLLTTCVIARAVYYSEAHAGLGASGGRDALVSLDNPATQAKHARAMLEVKQQASSQWQKCNTITHGGKRWACPATHAAGDNNKCMDTNELPDGHPCAPEGVTMTPGSGVIGKPVTIKCTEADLAKWGASVSSKYIKVMQSPLAEKLAIGTMGEFCKPIDPLKFVPLTPEEAEKGDTGVTFRFLHGLTALVVVGSARGGVDYALYVDGVAANPEFDGTIERQNITTRQIYGDSYDTTELDAARWARYNHMFFFPEPVKQVTISLFAEPNATVRTHPDDWVPHITIDAVNFLFPNDFQATPVPAEVAEGDATEAPSRRRLATQQGCFTTSGTSPRAAGVPVSYCSPNTEKNGALCYPLCNAGYYGAGPVCWQSCDAGYTDTGTGCQIWADSKGKGCCCVWEPCCFGCAWNCNNGCCGCSDAGYTDTGCTCYKPPQYYIKATYGRTAGVAMTCQPSEQYDAGLCYTPCPAGYDSVGPLCWKTNCPDPIFPYACGRGVCTRDGATCGAYATAVGSGAGIVIGAVAACVFSAGTLCGMSGGFVKFGAQILAQATDAVFNEC